MAPALRKCKTEKALEEVIVRRLKSCTKGLGYWAAVDALKHMATSRALRIMTLSSSKGGAS